MQRQFDIAVLGAGSAGLTAADIARRLGASVVLVEANRIGGDCTWTGCVPSKALIRAAHTRYEQTHASRFGLSETAERTDLALVLRGVHQTIARVYEHETPSALKGKGIDVIEGAAIFENERTIRVGNERIHADRFVVCSGAEPSLPPIEGLASVGYLTYETIWDMQEMPGHLLVFGGGPIGCEMAQSFSRLGSRVTLVEAGPRLLPRDEASASELLETVFREEGIEILTGEPVQRVSREHHGIVVTTASGHVSGDCLLVATGRRPRTAGLGLDEAGIRHGPRGIEVDRHLRTTAPTVFAAGDCTGGFQFTHYAGWQAGIATRNALLPGKDRGVLNSVPWTTFTAPEVAHAGLSAEQARERHGSVVVHDWPLSRVDRAYTDGDTRGFVRVVATGNGKPLGVTIVAPRAGEMLHEWTVTIARGIRVDLLSGILHVYPSYSMASMEMATDVRLGRLTAGWKGSLLRIARVLAKRLPWL